MKKIAVLLAAYNGEQFISQQIDSILKQSLEVASIYVSIDLSTDNTFEKVKKLAESFSKVIVLPYGQQFGGASPNFFRLFQDVDLSAYDYIALADQDDLWLPDKLKRAVDLMIGKKYEVVSSDVLAFWPDGKQRKIVKSNPQKKFDHFFEAAGPGCTYVFNAVAAEYLKRFITKNFTALSEIKSNHDWLFYAYCRHSGFSWYIDNQPLMLYRQHSSNMVGTNTGIKAYSTRLKLIKSKWYRKQVRNITTLVAPEYCLRFENSLFLIRNIGQLRRTFRDRLAFLCVLILRIY